MKLFATRDQQQALLILFGFFLLSLFWFGRYLGYSSVVSVDLPGHVALIERLAEHVWQGRIFFYDPWWFAGWSTYQFYGFFAHLVTILLLPLTAIFSREPALLAVHLVLLIGCATLPISLYGAARALQRGEGIEGSDFPLRTMTAVVAGTVTFWFLNQPLDFFGIGAGALWHGGLYTQIFAWHLLSFASIGLFVLSHNQRFWAIMVTAVAIALLLVTNIFAAVFSFYLLSAAFLRFSASRISILVVFSLSLALSCFWWLPMVMTATDYTIAHSTGPEGDLLAMLIRQPLVEFVSLIGQLLRGRFVPVEITPLLMGIIAIASFASPRFWLQQRAVAFWLFGLTALLLFSSHYVADSLPLGLHYYRFNAFILFYLLVLVTSSSAHLYHVWADFIVKMNLARVLRSSILIICISATMMTIAIGILRERAVSKSAERSSYKAQSRVLGILRQGPKEGRVAFEYFRDRRIFPFLSPHYMESKLKDLSARESLQGLFIQSSLAAQFAAQSLFSLGFDVYRVPSLWGTDSRFPRDLALEQLRDFSISQVVSATVESARLMAQDVSEAVQSVPPYQITTVTNNPSGMIVPMQKQLIGYRDRQGGLPFKIVESYFYADPELYRKTMLIEISDDLVPSGTLLLSHGEGVESDNVSFSLSPQIHSSLPSTLAHDQMLYRAFSREMENGLRGKLLAEAFSFNQSSLDPKSQIAFLSKRQEFIIQGLQPGAPVQMNYSYSPYFEAIGGQMFRGIREAMIIIPSGEEMILRYDRLKDPVVFLSLLVSGLTMVIICGFGVVRLRRYRRVG